MPPTFADELQEASIDGIAFPVSNRRARGGNSYGRAKYPYRAGQDSEHTGREPYVFELELPLFNGVDWPDELWPAKWDALRGALEDPERRGLYEYVDPIVGPLPCIVTDWSEDARAEPRDGVLVHITIEENQLDTGTFAIRPDRDAAGTASRLAEDLDAATADAGLDDDDISTAFEAYGVPLNDGDPVELGSGNVVSSLVGDFTDALAEGALAKDAIAAKVDEIRSRIDAIRVLPESQDPRNWSLLYATERLIASVTDIAETARSKTRPVEDYRVPATISVYEIAAQIYGDVSGADDILARNRIADPLFIPAGTVLRVLAATG